MADDGNNGHEPIPGATLDLETLQREDGVIPRLLQSMNRESSGVLAKAMTAIEKNEDYRQELKTGFFTSPNKQMQVVLALDECRECGIDLTLVVDAIVAMKAGTNGGLMHDIFEALTHTTFNTNYTGKGGNRRWNKGESRNGTSSPID